MLRTLEDIKKFTEKIDGWLSFEEGKFLYETAKKCAGRGAVVEIGSWKGKSTVWIAHGLHDGGGGIVYAIDPHTGAPEHHIQFKTKDIWTFNEFKKSIKAAGIESHVTPIVDRSENVAAKWEEPVAFVWIDGAHAYEAAALDFDSWFPHLIEGGVIAYHDSTFDDVKRVVKEKIFFSPHFREAGLVDSISFATKVNSRDQGIFDALRNRYIYFLNVLCGLRRVPLPRFIRGPLKVFFKKFIDILQ